MPRILDFSDGFTSATPAVTTTYTAADIANVPSGNLAATNVQGALNELQGDINTINASVGQASGIASLDGSGKIPTAQLPSIALVDVYPVADIAARDALTVQEGDVALVNDAGSGQKQAYIYNGSSWSALNAEVSLLAHEADTTNVHGISDTANLSYKTAVETLTNKTLTSPTINTPTIDVMTIDGQGSAPAAPSAGFYKIYVKDSDGKAYIKNSSDQETKLGSGAGGVPNFITNADAETDTTGWATYADAAATSPVDGTGGSATVTWTRSTSSPLSDLASFIFTKDAANRQGQGASFDFSIDAAAKGKLMQVSFDFLVNSGTFAASDGSTDSDVTVWLYDVTNSQLIQPTSYRLMSNSSSVPFQFVGNFQSSSGSTSYRLILHVSTTSASAYTLKIDNVIVSRAQYSLGVNPIITDWKSFTFTVGGSTTAPTEGGGVTKSGFWRRVGDSMEIQWNYEHTSAGANGSGTYIYPLPTGYAIDTTKITASTTDIVGNCGSGGLYTTSAGAFGTGVAKVYNSTGVSLFLHNSNDFNEVYHGSGGFNFGETGIRISIRAVVPIVGWNAHPPQSVDISTQAVVAASYYCSANFAASTTTPVNYDTKEYDTHNAVTTSPTAWKFTAPISGTYHITGSGSSTTGGQFAVLYKNGSAYKGCGCVASGGANSSGVIDVTVKLTAGDYIDIRPIAANTVTGNTLGATTSSPASNISIVRVSDVNTIVMVGGGKKIGYDHTTATALTMGVNHMHAVRVYANNDAVITRLGVFLAANAAGKPFVLGIYDQNGSSLPGTKLAQTSQYTTVGTDGNYRTFDLNNSVYVKKDTAYWLVVHSSSSLIVENAFNSSTVGGQKYRDLAYSSTLPATFGTPTGDAGGGVSMGGF